MIPSNGGVCSCQCVHILLFGNVRYMLYFKRNSGCCFSVTAPNALEDRTTTWRLPRCPAASAGSRLTAHLVRARGVEGPYGCCAASAAARVRPEQPADPDIPRGNVHQQHVSDAIQEGQLRSRRRHLSSGNKVRHFPLSLPPPIASFSSLLSQIRSTVRGPILEQFEILNDAVFIFDDDIVGNCM